MLGKSEKTNQWIIGYFLFNVFVFFYIYLFFHEEWISTIISTIVPLFVWEVLIFGILAPDEVFIELLGGFDNPTSNSRNFTSPIQSVRAALISSGDY